MTGEARGNFPQAFSHIGLINSALRLSEARETLLEPAHSKRPASLSDVETAPGLTGAERSERDGESGHSD